MHVKKKISVVTFGSATVRNGGAFLTRRIITALDFLKEDVQILRVGGIRGARLSAVSVMAAIAGGLRSGLDPRVGVDIDRVVGELKAYEPDIVVLDSTLLGGLAQRIRTMFPATKIVSIAHNNEYRYAQLGVRLGSVSKLPYLPIARKSEALCVRYSDYIVTFSDRNLEYFSSAIFGNVRADVVRWYAPMSPVERRRQSGPAEFDFAIAASSNVFNREPLAAAIEYVHRVQKYRLVIGGNIAHGVRGSEFVTPYGFFADPLTLYSLANATLNLMRLGEGIKIKTVESLELGVPVIGFKEAFEGIEISEFPGLCYIVDSVDHITDAYESAKDLSFGEIAVSPSHSIASFQADVEKLFERCMNEAVR